MKKKIIGIVLELLLTISLIMPVYLFHEFAHDYWIGATTAYLAVIIMGKNREEFKPLNQ